MNGKEIDNAEKERELTVKQSPATREEDSLDVELFYMWNLMWSSSLWSRELAKPSLLMLIFDLC